MALRVDCRAQVRWPVADRVWQEDKTRRRHWG